MWKHSPDYDLRIQLRAVFPLALLIRILLRHSFVSCIQCKSFHLHVHFFFAPVYLFFPESEATCVFLTHNFSISFPSLSLTSNYPSPQNTTFLPSSIVFVSQLQFISISSCLPIHLVDYLFICLFICFSLYLFSEVPAFSPQGANLVLIDDLISFAFALTLLESQIITWNNSRAVFSPNRINYSHKKVPHTYLHAFSCCNMFTCVHFSYLLKKVNNNINTS